jgi:hypothetical protein
MFIGVLEEPGVLELLEGLVVAVAFKLEAVVVVAVVVISERERELVDGEILETFCDDSLLLVAGWLGEFVMKALLVD